MIRDAHCSRATVTLLNYPMLPTQLAQCQSAKAPLLLIPVPSLQSEEALTLASLASSRMLMNKVPRG